MNPEIEYWTNQADPALPMRLDISSSAEANLMITSNRDNPSVPIIGSFHTQVPAERLVTLVAALRAHDFLSMSNPESALPGQIVRKLHLRESDQTEIMKFVVETTQPPPAFLAAERLTLSLIDFVRQYPVYAIEMSATPLPRQIQRSERMSLAFVLRNVGSETIRFPEPDMWKDEETVFELTGTRIDVPLSELREHHRRRLQLASKDIRVVYPSGSSSPFIELRHGEQLEISFKMQMDWPAGRYGVVRSMAGSVYSVKDELALRGEIILPIFTVSIVEPSAPR